MKHLIHAEAIIFDLDGVIGDTRTALRETWTRWCNIHSISLEKVREVSHGRRVVETISLVAPHLDSQKESLLLSQIELDLANNSSPIQGIIKFIESIADIKWAVCTSSLRNTANAKLLQILGYIPKNLICGEDTENGKPAPDPYTKACNQLKAAPENTIVFEDSAKGIESAKKAGCKVIGVQSASRKEFIQDAHYCINDFRNIKVISVSEGKVTMVLSSLD